MQEQVKNSCYWREREREREKEEEDSPGDGACGPQAPYGRGQGAGRASWPPGPLVAPPGQPQVPLGHSRHGNFYFYFSGFFLKTSLLKISRSSKSCKTF